MQNNEEEKGAPNGVENIHPDSKYDNWTIRSYEVKTRYEDIPQWMKMYAESSIDTHEFFKFERFEYKELDDWQKMLLKLYREDLRKVIRYYEDYRASLLKEIMDRTKKEREQVSSDTESVNRHTVCNDKSERPTVSLENKQQLKTLLSLDDHLPIDNKLSPDKLSPGKLSPAGSLTSPPVRFKRFGHRSSSRSRTNNEEDMLAAVTNHQNKQSEETTPEKVISDVTAPPCDITTPPSNPSSPTTASKETSPKTNGSRENVLEYGSSEVITEQFESPKLERCRGRRRVRGKLHPSLFNTENIAPQSNTAPLNDFPSPVHFRSASSRHSTTLTDLPSPLLMRSASDRPHRHSVHTSLLHGVYRDSISSCNTLDSDDSSFSRDSNKRGSARVIMSPKMKGKSEPGTNNVTVIPDKKEKILTKFLSRATSFGRKDKNKVKAMSRDSSRERSRRDSPREGSRRSRKEGFVTGPKGALLPKETSV